MRTPPIPRRTSWHNRVGRKVGVEKVDGHFKPAHALNVIAPAAKLDAPIFQGHGYARGFFLEKILDVPDHRLFRLGAVLREMLREVSPAVEERYGHHGKTKVRGGTDRVTGKNAESAAVAGHGVLERNLHGKVGDKPFD
jgi:hypothetical protein